MEVKELRNHFISLLAKVDGKTNIDDIELSARVRRNLEAAGFITADDLYKRVMAHGIQTIHRIPNFGRKSINEVLEVFFIDGEYYSIGKKINRMHSVIYNLECLGLMEDDNGWVD